MNWNWFVLLGLSASLLTYCECWVGCFWRGHACSFEKGCWSLSPTWQTSDGFYLMKWKTAIWQSQFVHSLENTEKN